MTLPRTLVFTLTAFGLIAADKVKPRPRDNVKVTPATEKIIQGALKYMASKQKADGSWGSSREEARHPVAITGYALIAFQAAGNLPGEGPYGKHVTKGCLLYTSPSPRDATLSRMPSSA